MISRNQLIDWLQTRVAESLYMEPQEIKIDEPLEHYGIGSRESLMISGDLEELCNRELPHTLLWDYPTIKLLVGHLLGEENHTRDQMEQGSVEPIAIIGIGCRFPRASTPSAFWQMLMDGTDGITLAANRNLTSDMEQTYPQIGFGGFLDEIDQFDPAFFGISPREAEQMDPNQRLLLEVTWEALEDAGLTTEQLKGSNTGVYVGISANEYARFTTEKKEIYQATGNAFSIAANRISYFFDWYGPSMAIDTACSSSLVAVDLACQALWSGRTSLAVAGGVNLILSLDNSIRFASAGMLAADGRCKTFDQRADGYVRGEGAGVVILKPLSKALEDEDSIYAVIHSSFVNQDGKSNGLTAPNGQAQRCLLREAAKLARIETTQMYYVETHGTGTALGDPIEVSAISEVYANGRAEGQPLYLGSVKTNIGHLESAAGIAGLIKVALSMKHRTIPPQLHFTDWNPKIAADLSRLHVVTEAWPIPKDAYLSVSSFGFGGTNAHLIVGSAPEVDITGDPTSDQFAVLPISAKSEGSLASQINAYQHHLSKSDEHWKDIVSTAWRKRDHHALRCALIANDKQEAINLLSLMDKKIEHPQVVKTPTKQFHQVVFVFSGQGPRWSISSAFLEQEPLLKEILWECELLLRPYVTWSLLEEIVRPVPSLDPTEAQPLYFAIQVALAKLWMSYGIIPSAVVGHSLGEVAAAYIAGAITLPDAIQIVVERYRHAKQLAGKGKMLVVQATKQEAKKLVEESGGKLIIGAYNSPINHVLSGETNYLQQLQKELSDKGKFARFVPSMDYASHSPQMEEIRDSFELKLVELKPKEVEIPFFSTVTGHRFAGEELAATYWCDNLCKPVQFQQAISALLQDRQQFFLEISPHPVMEYPIMECANEIGNEIVTVPSLSKGKPEQLSYLSSVATLYAYGMQIIWPAKARCVSLPTYAWDRQRYWNDTLHSVEEVKSPSTKEQINEESSKDYLTKLIAETLKVATSEIPLEKPMIELGLDSIMAMRIKSKVEQDLGLAISVVPILQGCSVRELLQQIP